MTLTQPGQDSPAVYEFRIRGRLDRRWASWFEQLALSHDDDGTTTLRGTVVDQAALHGVLERLRDLGATLISLRTIDEAKGS